VRGGHEQHGHLEVRLDQRPPRRRREVTDPARAQDAVDLVQVHLLGGAIADVLDDVVGHHDVEARVVEGQGDTRGQRELVALLVDPGVHGVDADRGPGTSSGTRQFGRDDSRAGADLEDGGPGQRALAVDQGDDLARLVAAALDVEVHVLAPAAVGLELAGRSGVVGRHSVKSPSGVGVG